MKNTRIILLPLLLIIACYSMKGQSDCESILGKKFNLKGNQEEIMQDLSLLESCGLLPENFYEFPFQLLFFDSTKQESLTYADLFESMDIIGNQILEEKERRQRILNLPATVENWENDKWELMSCKVSYFDILVIEDYLKREEGVRNDSTIETYSDIRFRVRTTDHDEFLNRQSSRENRLFKVLSDFDLDTRYEKPRLIYFRGNNNDSNEKIERLIYGYDGIAYKIYRDYEFIVLDTNDTTEMEKEDGSTINVGELNRSVKKKLLTTDSFDVFCILGKDNEVLSSIGIATRQKFIEFLERK